MKQVQGTDAGESIVRVTTEDTQLLLPALVQVGASFHLMGRVLELRGVDEAEVAALAALHNARVVDMEIVRTGHDEGNASQTAGAVAGELAA